MRSHTYILALAAAASLIGCGGEGNVRIDSTLAESTALDAARQVGATLELDNAAGTLAIERARIAVSEVELEGEEEDGDAEFEMGKRVVEVSLDGVATEVVAQAVPAGTYAELGMELMIATGAHGAEFADFGAGSIVVDGTYAGSPFRYTSTVAPELEFNLPAPVDVAAGGEARVAVTFDVAAWFLGAAGVALDPTDPQNRSVIENNILNSMAAVADLEFEDDD